MKKFLSIMLCLSIAISLISVAGITANVVANPTDITDGLIVHYDFNESEGTAVQDKIGTVDTYPSAHADWSQASAPANRVFKDGQPNTRVQGSLDGAIKFADHKNREHIYANADKLRTVTGDMTISTWVSFEKLRSGVMQFLFTAGTFQDAGASHEHSLVWLITGDGNHIKYEIKSGSYSKAIEANRTFIEPDTFNLLTVTQTGNTVTLYVNGYLVAQDTNFTGKIADIFNGAPTDHPMKMDIGGNSVWGGNDNLEESMKGTMDDFRIYNRALSEAEVGNLCDYLNESSTDKTKLHPKIDPNAIWEVNIQDDETPGNRANVNPDGSFTPKENNAMYWCVFLPSLFNTRYENQTLYIKTYAKVNVTDGSKPDVGAFFSQGGGYWQGEERKNLGDFIADNGGNWNGDKYVSIVIPVPYYAGRDLTKEFGLRSNVDWSASGLAFYRTAVISTDSTPLPAHPANAIIDRIAALGAITNKSKKVEVEAIRGMINALHFKDQNSFAITNLNEFIAKEALLEDFMAQDIVFNVKDAGGRGTVNADGSRTHNADETMVWGMEASLPTGTYYMKFLAKGTGLDGKSGRISYVDGKQDSGGTHVFDTSLADITTFTEDTWKSIVVEFTVSEANNNKAVEYRVGGPLNGIATFTVGPQVVLSINNTPLPLPGATDKSALNAAITAAETLHNAAAEGYAIGNYISGSKATYLAAINAAKAVANNMSATQTQIDAAVTALNSATTTFAAAVLTVDKTELAAAIAELEAILSGLDIGTGPKQYPQELKDEIEELLTEAKGILNDNEATEDDVEDALLAIEILIELLPLCTNEFIEVMEQLAEIMAKIEEYLENAEDYDAEAISKLEEAYLDALMAYVEAILDGGELDIELFRALLNSLQEALAEFESSIVVAGTDKEALNEAIAEAEALYKAAVEGTAKGQYKAGSKAKLQAAIDAAKAVADDEDATQEEIDAALEALLAAIAEFEDAKVNENPKTGDMMPQTVVALMGLSGIGTVAILRKKRLAK